MSDPVDESQVDPEMAAAAAAYHHDMNQHHHQQQQMQHQQHHVEDVDVDEQHVGEDGDDAHANSKWSRNGFGATVPKQVGKFSKEESELVKKAVEEYCAAKQISTARLCSECDHKVCNM
jgi:hypothetical protein